MGEAREATKLPSQNMSISDVLDRIKDQTDGEDVSIADLLDMFGRRAYGPLLFLLGLIAVSPVGAIPGASIVLATVITLLCAQMIFRSGSPWLPGRILSMAVDRDKAGASVEKLRHSVEKFEVLVRPRLTVLASEPLTCVVPIACILLETGFLICMPKERGRGA